MVLRVDVVAAALDAAYGGAPDHRVVALTPQGRPLTQEVVEELAKEEHLTLLSARFEGFDERIVEHLCTDSISIGPYVLSNGDLPAMVLVDAIARRLPGALAEGSGELESFSAELERQARVPALHAPGRVPRLARSRRPAVGRPWPNRELAEGACPLRNPIDRLTVGLPRRPARHDRLARHDPGRDPDRARDQAVGDQPVPDPVELDGADAPLRATRATAASRRAASSAAPTACSPAASATTIWSPKRGDIVVFNTPPRALVACGTGGVYVKRLIGLPGDTWAEKNGYVYINGKKLDEPYIKPAVPRPLHATRRRRSRRGSTS